MEDTSWIKLFRKFVDWEWYGDKNTKVLFIHLLLKANYQEKSWKGIKIGRGQFITSLKHLADDVGLTIQEVRTSLKKLKSTKDITIKTTNKYSLITIENFDKYQSIVKENSNQITNEKQTNNNPLTTTKDNNNIKMKRMKENMYHEDAFLKIMRKAGME